MATFFAPKLTHSPADNAKIVVDYLAYAKSSKAQFQSLARLGAQAIQPFAEHLATAAIAMKELVYQATNDMGVRHDVFAAQGILSLVLFQEPLGYTDQLLAMKGVGYSWVDAFLSTVDGSIGQIMLDGIYEAGNGGFVSKKDPTGVTSWIESAPLAGAPFEYAIRTSGDPFIVSAGLRILADLAIPTEWITIVTNARVFDSLRERLATGPWGMGTRIVIQALTNRAEGHIQQIASQVATVGFSLDQLGPGVDMSALAALGYTNVTTGNGLPTPTTPPPPKAWYRRGELWSAGVFGAILGGITAAKPLPRA